MAKAFDSSNFLFRQELVEKELQGGIADIIRKDFPKVEKRADLSPKAFINDYVKEQRPVVLSGLAEKSKDFNLEYFEHNASNEKVLIDLYDTKSIREGTIKDLISEIKASTPDKPVYLQEWWFQEALPNIIDSIFPIPHLKDNWIEKVLGFNIYTLWIGSKGALTPIHEDTTTFNLISLQMFGKKEWMFLSKDAYLQKDSSGKPDFDRLLEDKKASPMSITLEDGDLLYMPAKWWHRTETLEHSASINTAFITEDIIQPYMRDLMKIPLMLALEGQALKKLNPVRYNVSKERAAKIAQLLDFDPEYIIRNSMNLTDEEQLSQAA